jgi:hypothetical protein
LAHRFDGPDPDGRYYFKPNGVLEQSGGRKENISKAALVDTGEVRRGACWFFSHDAPAMYGTGIHMTTPCRVYRALAALPEA